MLRIRQNIGKLFAAFVGILAMTACSSSSQAAAKQDSEALSVALDDEYRAEAIYAAIIKKFGDVRPFINIIEAERRHSSRVKEDMDRIGLSYADKNPYLGKIDAPASLLDACRRGVTAEQENIALYDRLLPSIKDTQIRDTLTALQWASRERHLSAFERCVARGGTMGGGGDRGGGHGKRN